MLCCILSFAALASGQTATTSLRGVVKDSSGALVPGAAVALKDQANDNSYHAVSSSAGFYIFPVIAPAHYLITIASNGFATQTRTAELLVNQPATIDFALSIKSDTVTVDVSSAAETLNFTDATIGNAVGSTTIESIPMEGRDPISLLSLQPGVLYIGQPTGSADSRQGAVAGGRSDQGNITLDGLDDNDQIGGAAFTGVLRSTLDSTEEFRVTTSNGTAEAGRSSGAQVNLVTKSGTNRYHGTAYEYYRPTNTVANDYFNKNNELSSGEPNIPQKYVQNVFGGSIGAPIKKDKLFYFFNYEGLRRAIDQVVGATVPTASFMAGALGYVDGNGNNDVVTAGQVAQLDAACASNSYNSAPVCPWGAGADPNILSYYAGVPTATGAASGDGLNSGSLFFPSPAPFTQNTSILKLDYNINSANRIFVRGNLQKDTSAGAENLPGQSPASFTDDNTKGIGAGYTWTPTANIVNDLRYGYTRQGYQTSGVASGDYVVILDLTQPVAQTRNNRLHVPVNNITDTLDWTKGAHTFAVGGNWCAITNQHGTDANSFNNALTNAYYTNASTLPDPSAIGLPPVYNTGFAASWMVAYGDLVGIVPQLNDVYNFKINNATTATALPDGTFVNRSFHTNEFEYFLQDSWHVRSNLNISFGLRHTLLHTPYETSGQQVTPTIDTDAWYKKRESAAQQSQVYEPLLEFAPAGKGNHLPGYWPKQKTNIAPRLGIVFSPDSKTSIRASAGMYFDHFGEALVNSFDQEGSFGVSATLSNQSQVLGFENSPRFTGPHDLPNIPMPAVQNPQTFPFQLPQYGFGLYWGLDNKMKTPYAESFDLSFQHQLPGGFSFEEAYVGRLGRHLLQQLDLAEPVDYVDPGGGGDYFTAAKKLSAIVDAHAAGPAVVSSIPYFEDVFPYMRGFDGPGESATQAIYNNEWAPYRYTNGETTSLADLDFFCFNNQRQVAYNCPAQSRFWNSEFSTLYAWDSIGTSSYNALQFTLRHPPSHGLTTDVSYTFSKSLDLGSETERASVWGLADNYYTNFAIQNTWSPKLNRGPSDFDTHSLFTADWVYALPVGRGKSLLGDTNRVADALIGGWQWAGLGRWTSGLPFTLLSPAFPTNWDLQAYGVETGAVKLRKHLVNGIPQIFDNPSAISNGIYTGNPVRLAYPGEAGQRNNYRGDGYFDLDSSLTKSWNLGDWARLKFAAEAYNLTNSARFDVSPVGLNGQTASGTLGSYGATLSTYRRMQFSLRMDF
jgi:hypothetical protein